MSYLIKNRGKQMTGLAKSLLGRTTGDNHHLRNVRGLGKENVVNKCFYLMLFNASLGKEINSNGRFCVRHFLRDFA